MMRDLNTVLDFAIHIAQEAGKITLRYFNHGVEPEFKSDESPVTIADREAETFIRREIETRYPSHGILGEEHGEKPAPNSGGYRWVIDPIDGTRAFVRGVPLYGVLIGLELAGEVCVGVAHYPALGETLSAASGQGCWWNGRKAQVSKVTRLQDALLAHSDTASFGRLGRMAAWERLQKATGFRAGWGDCYGYLLVATGRADVMIDPIMNAWDCGPFPVILSEAGGYFGDWRGNVTMHGGEAVATNAALREQVLEILSVN